MIVAWGEDAKLHTHNTACAALELAGSEWYMVAYAHFANWFGQPKQYWFGRDDVFEPLKDTDLDKYYERIAEVLANQQARIYALLFMREIALRGDFE